MYEIVYIVWVILYDLYRMAFIPEFGSSWRSSSWDSSRSISRWHRNWKFLSAIISICICMSVCICLSYTVYKVNFHFFIDWPDSLSLSIRFFISLIFRTSELSVCGFETQQQQIITNKTRTTPKPAANKPKFDSFNGLSQWSLSKQ